MTHLKQHAFNPPTCVSLVAPISRKPVCLCDHPLQSAPDYFDRDDPRWQAEESENALRAATPEPERMKHAGRFH